MRSSATRMPCCASTRPAPQPQAARPDWSRLRVADMSRPMTAIATSTSTRVYPACARSRPMPHRLSHDPGRVNVQLSRHRARCRAVWIARRRPSLYVERAAEGANEANGPFSAPWPSVEDGLGRIRRIVVEAAPGLAPEVAALDPLLELLGRPVGFVLGHLVGLEAGVVADVETREVAELEGPERVVETELHRFVDIGVAGYPLLEAVVRLADQGAEDAVDEEARQLFSQDHRLAAAPTRHLGRDLHRLLGRPLPLDDLHELHDERRVEVVHVDTLLGPLGRGSDLGVHQRRRVGREDGVGRAEAVELGEAFLLRLEPLHDGLDGEVGVARGLLEVRLESHPGDGLFHLVLRHLPLLDAALELLAVAGHALLAELHAEVVERDLVAVQRGLHRDLRAHLSCAYHEDPLDVVGGHVVSFVIRLPVRRLDRKSTRLNSSHITISYAV